MKTNRFNRLLLLILVSNTFVVDSYSQKWLTDLSRIDLDAIYKPFYHGVASGDPHSDAVIIWTRVTPDTITTGNITVEWKIATDTNMTNIVNSGTTITNDSVDYTVKVDVNGLQADTWYYYKFMALNRNSLIGRTKTSPVGDNNQVRFAVVSCSSYEHGYFNAYERIATRNDIDAILHLGDYIYEYKAGGYSNNIIDRNYEPSNELISLSDYRTRMSLYHLDHDLRFLHQQYPFIMVWDDHETANNSWMNGANNHDSLTEGAWIDRKSAALQAYFEWLPIRKPDQNDNDRIYRKFSYGDLLDLYMLDTRLEGRDQQVAANSPQLNDSSRSILGIEQFNWLVNNLDSSTAQWKILGQQVMIAPLLAFGTPLNTDQWDGYPIERQKLFNNLDSNGVNNLVVLTGDIHTSWGNDLPFHPSINYVPGTGSGSMGVEFVTTSITSPGLPLQISPNLIKLSNPHVKYVDLDQKGYIIIDINKIKTQADWYYVPTITSVDHSDAYGESWYCNNLDGFLNGSSIASSSFTPAPAKPPLLPNNSVVGIKNSTPNKAVLFGIYPNPFEDKILTKFFLYGKAEVNMKVIDMSGKEVISKKLGKLNKGLFYSDINVSKLAAGTYLFLLELPSQTLKRKIIKN